MVNFTDLLSKAVLNLDILAPEYRLNINGKVRYRTLTGVILTIAWMTCLAGGAYYSFLSYSNTNSPISSSETYQKISYPTIELKSSNLLPMFVMFWDFTTLISHKDIAKYVTVYAEKAGYDFSGDNPEVDTFKPTRFNLVSCSEVVNKTNSGYKHLDNFIDPFIEKMINTDSLCVDVGEGVTVVGNQMEQLYHRFRFVVKPCSLSSGCATAEELARVNFFVVTPQTSFQASDFDDPIKVIPNYDLSYYINMGANQMYTARINENIVSDYRGLPPSWTERKRFHDIKDVVLNLANRDPALTTCQAKDIHDDRLCPSYFEYYMQSSTSVTQFARTYKTLVQSVAEIGGINQFVYTVIFIMYVYYNLASRDNYILNKVYGLLDSKKVAQNAKIHPNTAEKPLSSSRDNLDSKISSTSKRQPDVLSDQDFEKTPTVPISLLQRWLLCRKKTKEQRLLEAKERAAFDSIRQTLNIENIVMELNRVKVLCHCLFQARHFRLSSDVQLNLARHSQLVKTRATAASSSKVSPATGQPAGIDVKATEEGLAEQLTYWEALSQLQSASRLSGVQDGGMSFVGQLDKLYGDLLARDPLQWSDLEPSDRKMVGQVEDIWTPLDGQCEPDEKVVPGDSEDMNQPKMKAKYVKNPSVFKTKSEIEHVKLDSDLLTKKSVNLNKMTLAPKNKIELNKM